MVFSSHIFIFYFLPIFLLTYYFMYWVKSSVSWLNLCITIASYFFYGWFEPWFVTLMWVSTFVDYYSGKMISASGASPMQRNAGLAISMTVNLGLLGFFKYYMFFMGGMNTLIQTFGGGANFFYVYNIVLPIGISFYTFQTMSYTIDVWRGDAPPVKDMRTFSCFVALFPQLIAGPIIRYNTVAEQLAHRTHTLSKFSIGTLLFIVGLGKKILLANPMGQIADTVFGADAPTMLSAWWGALGYSFQIYFDFCAYSDMAVGLGLMLGFEFVKNFNAPYRALSMTDFWRRWHISLTKWFTDYLYISLGGNRVNSKARLYFNLLTVMFLSGLWHGAQWTFIAWGLFHAFWLILERFLGKDALYARAPVALKIVLTNIIVLYAWVLFRAPDLNQAMLYWASMSGLREAAPSAGLLYAQIFTPSSIFYMVLCILLVLQPVQAFDWARRLSATKLILGVAVLIVSLAAMFTQSFNPFLYFQF
jgi:alginate O-acetyltransferase complex protein AlgI